MASSPPPGKRPHRTGDRLAPGARVPRPGARHCAVGRGSGIFLHPWPRGAAPARKEQDPPTAKGDTHVESQRPPGSKPPSDPSPSEKVWISPRLREKLEDSEPGGPRKEGGSPLVGIVLAVLVIGGGAGL